MSDETTGHPPGNGPGNEDRVDGDRWLRERWMPELDAVFAGHLNDGTAGQEMLMDRIPPGPTRPNPARIYDYWLGGKDHFECDRDVAVEVARTAPWAPAGARACREFLRGSVLWLTAAGADQFLDIGSGLPTAGNVHQVAQTLNPTARVVYVDHDPVVLVHARTLAATDPGVSVLDGDARSPAAILDAVRDGGLLDLDRPVVLLLSALLHFIGDHDHPHQILATLREALAPGSYLLISHVVADDDPVGQRTRAAVEQSAASAGGFSARTTAEITALFDGFDLVPPGVARLRVDSGDVTVLGGIGRRPPRRETPRDSSSRSGQGPSRRTG